MNVYTSINDLPNVENQIITIGSFDGVHLGHQKLLAKIRQIAHEFSCQCTVVTFHPHPRKILDSKNANIELLNLLDEKIDLLRKFGIDNLIIAPFSIEFSQQHPREYIEKFIIEKIKPSGIVIGYDHRFGHNRAGDFNLLKTYESNFKHGIFKIEKETIDEITVSSTKIRKSLSSGNIIDANALLGYPYFLRGKVIKGDGIGKTLGYPTANLQIDGKSKLIPQDGIYACKVKIDEVFYQSMLYIGHRPSIKNNDNKKIEVNIFNFNQDIYDKEIDIEFHAYLRGDQKFSDLDGLKNQLALDKIDAKSFFDSYKNEKNPAEVTLSILNYNGSDLLESFLPSVTDSTTRSNDIHLIDNNSSDDSIRLVSEWFPEIETIELSKNYGFADGYNKGLKNVTSKYTVLLNSDILANDGWLDPILDFMDKNPDVFAVMPKILSLENKSQFEYAGACGGLIDTFGYPFCKGRVFDHCEEDNGQYDEPSEVFWATGAAMVVRTDLFKKFGGFDADFFAHQEEVDLCWRVKNAGYKCYVMPNSHVHHLGGGTLNYGSKQKIYLNFRNNLVTILKNEKALKLLWLFPARLILDGIAGIQFMFKLNFMATWQILKSHFYIYTHLPKIYLKRRNVSDTNHRLRINYPNDKGMLKSSIVFKYFIQGKKEYSSF